MEEKAWQGKHWGKTRRYSYRMGNITDSRLMNGDILCQIVMERQRGNSSLMLGRNERGMTVHTGAKTQKEGYIWFYILVLCAWLVQPQLYFHVLINTWKNP